ncbi:28S ribosomal protein S31, mitochondrial isoform X2 [Pipistrellus kuhlii]|uniref:28S ribosomal protein S31, mitochondrial isoform X2 n=1 Tax=Pipistrellus kuhlii TaxID=59472 RepID=UPI001E271C12|nr:28S ribosomal protein S31, mitochondrial isoform X2 [Pipistrellus kuhlii]
MFPRVTAALPLRPLSRLPLCPGGPEAAAAAVRRGAPRGPGRIKNYIQRYFGTNNVNCSKEDGKSIPTQEISKQTESQNSVKDNSKKDLLNIIKDMKVEISTVNVQTTKPPNRRPLKNLEATTGRLKKATKDAPKKSFSNIISDMKVVKSATARASTRPVHQIQFDEGSDNYVGQEKTVDLIKRKSIFKGKRLNIFAVKAATEEALETETAPSLWDVEFAKQLAAVNEQSFQNGFEEIIQWTKEGKLWEFPINNEAGFDDDGSEFHEHIFLDKYLEDFPKQGPIRHFMELVTCGLSKNPYLSVKQKVEHIEWFKNYFNEKKDILKESDIQFN